MGSLSLLYLLHGFISYFSSNLVWWSLNSPEEIGGCVNSANNTTRKIGKKNSLLLFMLFMIISNWCPQPVENSGYQKSYLSSVIASHSPRIVVCHPPLSMPRLSSPIPEKLPKENVLRVGDTSKWSSWRRKGTPIRRCLFFPVWWKGIEPLRSRSSLRLLNCRKNVEEIYGGQLIRELQKAWNKNSELL